MADVDVIAEYRNEISRRRLASGPIEVMELAESLDAGESLAPGFALVAWAPQGSPQLRSLAEALRGLDAGRIEEILAAPPEEDHQAPLAEGEGFAALPALGELRYSGKTLMDAVTYVPGSDAVISAALPFSGGSIGADRFSAISYLLPEAAPIEFLVALDPPRASERERAIVAAVPEEVNEVHIAEMKPMTTPAAGAAATFVARATAAWMVTKAADKAAEKTAAWAQKAREEGRRAADRQRAREHAAQRAYPGYGRAAEHGDLSPELLDRLEQLDPTAATQELLRLRQELIEEQ